MYAFQLGETFGAAPLNLVSGITDFQILGAGPDLRLYSASRGGGGILAFDISEGLRLIDQQTTAAGGLLPSPAGLHAVTLGGVETLLVTGTSVSRATGYRIEATGTLGAPITSPGSLAGEVAAQTVATTGAGTFVWAVRSGEAVIHAARLNSDGSQTAVQSLTLGPPLQGTDIAALTTVEVGGRWLLVALSQRSDQILTFAVAANGELTAADVAGEEGGLGIADPMAVAPVAISGATYLVVASASSSTLSVLRLAADGRMSVTDHVIDTLDTRFAGVSALETVRLGDRAFVIAGGSDGGLQLFALLPGGRLEAMALTLQAPGLALQNITAISAHVTGARIEVFVASEGAGITRLTLDPGPLAPMQRGQAGADSLTGVAAGDLLDGGAGDDRLQGGEGSDILIDGAGADTLFGGAGRDVFVLSADAAVDQIRDFQLGLDRIDLSAWGRIHDLSALGISSTATGAVITWQSERLVITTGNGQPLLPSQFRLQDLVGLWHDLPFGGLQQPAGPAGTSDDDLQRGTASDDVFLGSRGADTVMGGGGVDTMDYSADSRGIRVDLGNPARNSGMAAGDQLRSVERVMGGSGRDTLEGTSSQETLLGGAGDDVLQGRGGADRIDGGAGRDTLIFASAASGVSVSLWRRTGDAGEAAGGSFLAIENVTGSAFADTVEGDAQANLLAGNAGADHLGGRDGNDTLRGGAGADTLDGGAGFDLADYTDTGLGIVVDLLDGALNAGGATGDVLIGIEAIAGGVGADRLAGTGAGNGLWGGAGADTLLGRGGADTLAGGPGRDLADFGGAPGGVTVDLQAGTAGAGRVNGIEDLWGSALNDVFWGDAGANSLRGQAGADWLSGRGGNDRLDGGVGNDTLAGGDGADLMRGGTGIDVADYRASAAPLRVDLTTPAANRGWALGDLLEGIEIVLGGSSGDHLAGGSLADTFEGRAGNDTLEGRSGNDRLFGGDGQDRLSGGAGRDSLSGGAGFDTAHHAGAGPGLVVDLADSTANRGEALGDVLSGIEALSGGVFADSLAGDAAGNHLSGGEGNDSLTGRAGNDTLRGGDGADWLDGGEGIDLADYLFSRGGMTVDLALSVRNEGIAAGDRFLSIEGVLAGAWNDRLSGTDTANLLFGGDGDDLVHGRAGDDRLEGGSGNDSFAGGPGNDVMIGGDGIDRASYAASTTGVQADLQAPGRNTAGAAGDSYIGIEGLEGSAHADRLWGDGAANRLVGRSGDDFLAGRGGHDHLSGGNGRDTLAGGTGNDLLFGGAGADLFLFDGGRDRIVDFDPALDRIGLSATVAAGRDLAQILSLSEREGGATLIRLSPGAVLQIDTLPDPARLGDWLFLI